MLCECQWNDDMNIDIPIINDQHKSMIFIIQEMIIFFDFGIEFDNKTQKGKMYLLYYILQWWFDHIREQDCNFFKDNANVDI